MTWKCCDCEREWDDQKEECSHCGRGKESSARIAAREASSVTKENAPFVGLHGPIYFERKQLNAVREELFKKCMAAKFVGDGITETDKFVFEILKHMGTV